MNQQPHWVRALVVALILVGGGLPAVLYWLNLGQLPILMPGEAIQMLNTPGSGAVLVDVRTPADYQRVHIAGSRNLPMQQVQGWATGEQLPAGLRENTWLLACENGWTSARAAFHLRAIGKPNLFLVRGGMQEWAKAAGRVPGAPYSAFTGLEAASFLPTQNMPVSEQAAQVAAGFLIKPLYTLGSLALALLLLREKEHDLAALRRGLFAFFLGELFCYVNFVVFGDDSYASEFLHSYGMVVGFGFIFYALLAGIETRRLHFDDINKHCGLIGLCLICSHYSRITCRVKRAVQLIIPVLALLATIPLMVRLDTTGYTSMIGPYPYYYARFAVYQLYENRLLPVMALICFMIAYLPIWVKTVPPLPLLTRIFTAAGLGALSFALLRLGLGSIYATNLVWFNFWEELTELIFVVAIAAVLWLFRVSLFPRGLPGPIEKLIQLRNS